ncbi:Gly-Xaa carboxypeptidase [Kwoniella heveanensis BCC8398]|uniref:Gly-Xaa carboxypeptidase n=1 Tax=Kwoniella heveanensis BCC8398 TaxID=1296120 RepID=A0A1B9GNV1_9TREE|nr:Gly-Xaa carboxypeptidase [Kwoniella heveanensis BCC8398]
MVSLNDEKTILPSSATVAPRSPDEPTKISWFSRQRKSLTIFLGLFLILQYFIAGPPAGLASLDRLKGHDSPRKSSCEQAEPIYPASFDVSALVDGQKDRIITWLSDAVKIPTEIFDVMGEIGEDPRWEVFYKFADYLEKAFPRVHEHLTRTRVVTHALIFEWQGSDPSLKPLLLTGHQDVVPVLNATRGLWTHDPFGGEYDGELIWGRGASDDKSGVIGVLSAIELLLESGKFNPTRTVILAFGIDEETGGKVGAYHLGQWIEEKYGKDSISILVDEGNGLQEVFGQLFAAPAVGEKGYMDLELRVETLGGHSSVPPPHTGIGYISLLIAALERHPHEPHLNVESPLVNMIACAADSAPSVPPKLRKAIRKVEDSLAAKKGKVDEKALKEIEDWYITGSYEDGSLGKGMGKALVSTTQAVDIINGGLKVNALPESVTAIVNHRINIASSVTELQERLVDVLGPVASKLNLELEAFGKKVQYQGCHTDEAPKGPKAGKVILDVAWNSSLEPAPVSPFTVDSAAWRLLSGTVKGVYNTRPEAQLNSEEAKKEIIMAPSISTGNTDTKRYWNLTRNIYRFAYQQGKSNGFNNVHTVDEHIPAAVFVEQVRWFLNFIVNVDESREV